MVFQSVKALNAKLLEFIALNDQPFSEVENAEFSRLFPQLETRDFSLLFKCE